MNDSMISVPSSLFGALRDFAGSDDTSSAEAQHRIGIAMGKQVADLLGEKIGGQAGSSVGEASVDAFWNALREFTTEAGWGSFEHERLHPGLISISSGDWFESRGASAEWPQCHTTVGLLGEVIRQIASREVAVLEVQCVATGENQCRFLIGSADAIDQIYEATSNGTHYREAAAALD